VINLAALGRFTDFNDLMGASCLTVLVTTLTALGAAAFLALLLRGAVGLVAVATVMKEIQLNSSILTIKKHPEGCFVIN